MIFTNVFGAILGLASIEKDNYLVDNHAAVRTFYIVCGLEDGTIIPKENKVSKCDRWIELCDKLPKGKKINHIIHHAFVDHIIHY